MVEMGPYSTVCPLLFLYSFYVIVKAVPVRVARNWTKCDYFLENFCTSENPVKSSNVAIVLALGGGSFCLKLVCNSRLSYPI